MHTLNKNWITEHQIDFEYKKYLLLAYLQHVSESFTDYKLYPYLGDLVEHYRNLKTLNENKTVLYNLFPERLRSADMEQFKMIYEKIVQDDSIMQEIQDILEYSIPQMERYLREGKKIYDLVEERMKVFPVGVIPLHPESGYLLLKDGSSTDTRVYEFHISIYENPQEKYRGIHVSYLASYEPSLINTFESIKSDLIRYHKNLPNPATFAIETDMAIPFEETFLPLAKRVIVKRIAAA